MEKSSAYVRCVACMLTTASEKDGSDAITDEKRVCKSNLWSYSKASISPCRIISAPQLLPTFARFVSEI